MYKLLIFVVLTCCFTLQAQSGDQKASTQNSSAESVIIEDEEDVLVGEEDEALLKANSANKNASDSGSAAENGSAKDDEELILDGDDEELLVDEEPVETEKISESAVSVQESVDSLTPQAAEASEDSAAAAPERQVYKPAPETQKITKSIESGVLIPSPKDGINLDSISPAQIEKMQSINFAENASKYRSPKIAMLMSFLIPGTGQAYAKCGWRAGVYGAAEVAIIAMGSVFGVKGKNAKKDAKNFANIHYDYERFNVYYEKLSRHFGTDTAVLGEIFNANSVDTFKVLYEKRTEDYYSALKEIDNPFIHGWDDVAPTFDDDFKIDTSSGYTQDSLPYFVYPDTNSSKSQFGFSKNQEKYRDLMSESNRNYRVAKSVFTILIVNHIVSAIDAGFTAKAYNDKLLGKQSFWQNINIKEQQVATASGLLNGYVLQVRF